MIPALHFRFYPAERLRIASIVSRLSQGEARLRDAILDGMIARQEPLASTELMASGWPAAELEELLATLVQKQAIVRNPEGKIIFAYPVSALPTSHRVTLADGRCLHAMCAVDALGSAFTFRQDVRIASHCSACREPVKVVIHDEGLAFCSPPNLHVLHVDLKQKDDWSGLC